MIGYDKTTYGSKIADVYDDWYSVHIDAGTTVAMLAELAGEGRALELGIGTGRVAIPLAARGIAVSGIDASQEMVDRLRAKPGGDLLPVTIGDLADVAVEGSFSLIYASFISFFMLQSQAEQLRCMRNVALHLTPEGAFVLDAFVPDPGRYSRRQNLVVQDLGPEHLLLEAARHDPVEQRIDSLHVIITESGIRLFPVALRYAWPAELDALALAAGLELTARYNGYDRRPFTSSSIQHVSIFRRMQP